MKYIAVALILSLFLAGCGTGFVVAPLDQVAPQDKDCIKERVKVQGEKDSIEIEKQYVVNEFNKLKTQYDILKNQELDCGNTDETLQQTQNSLETALSDLSACQNIACTPEVVYINETIVINDTIVINETIYIVNETALEECQLALDNCSTNCSE